MDRPDVQFRSILNSFVYSIELFSMHVPGVFSQDASGGECRFTKSTLVKSSTLVDSHVSEETWPRDRSGTHLTYNPIFCSSFQTQMNLHVFHQPGLCCSFDTTLLAPESLEVFLPKMSHDYGSATTRKGTVGQGADKFITCQYNRSGLSP